MTKYELAINEDGEPFGVPPETWGWRVRRSSDGRGRPSLVHARGKAKGKPLIVPVDASHADLLAAAGPGRYRLEAVDAEQHRIEGVPAGCTGPLTEDGNVDESEELNEAPAGTKPNLEGLLCQMVAANARMVEKSLEQMGTVMTGVAELLNAAHNAGITSRPPPPPPPTFLVQAREEEGDDEEEEDEDDEGSDDPSGGPSGIPEVVQFVIKETISKVVPLIFERLGASGGSIAGLPLEAILDWRKAVPTPAPPMSQPAAESPVVPPGPVAAPPPPAPSPAQPATSTGTPHPAAPVNPTHAGAAPNDTQPPGAVPAELAPTSSSLPSPDEAAAMVNAHIMKVWQGLSPPERARAGQLITQLPPEGRAALLAELARLTVPEAITRARAVIEAQSSPVPPL